MTAVTYTLTSEGRSDRVLLRYIDWVLAQYCSVEFSGQWADPSVFSCTDRCIENRTRQALMAYPCNLLFIHRDSDNAGYVARKTEIMTGARTGGAEQLVVAVIPVRMTEAWLLVDELAVRIASGNPKGTAHLNFPRGLAIERVADPKALLEDMLVTASELSGRKLTRFKRQLASAKRRVVEVIRDPSPLFQLPSFRNFGQDVCAALEQLGCLKQKQIGEKGDGGN